ncbi:MAG: hypothetical protein ACO3HG_08110, partial [Schleiferiaceae bacterium]
MNETTTMKTKTVYRATVTFTVQGRRPVTYQKGQEITPTQWTSLPTASARSRFEKIEKPAGRARFASGTIRELPTENGAVKT